MHTKKYRKRGQALSAKEERKQEPFWRTAPVVKTALLMGACGGFVLATILTLTSALAMPLGMWWEAIAQAHGHLQLYGWAGLFVLGIMLYFFPRLCGAPLTGARFIPWLLGIMIAGLILHTVSQPLLAISPAEVWRLAMMCSGVCEVVALMGILSMMVLTARRGPRPTTRPAYFSVLPFFAGACCTLGIASIVNLSNMVQAAQESGLVSSTGDTLNVTLGLFGFLVPIALAMSARSLPMYAGLDGFPRRWLWPLAGAYFTGLTLLSIGIADSLLPLWASVLSGLGMALTGGVVLFFVGTFLYLMRRRGRLPQRVMQFAPQPEQLSRTYQQQVKKEQAKYGPFVGLVASAYWWAMFGALLLLMDGISELSIGTPFFAIDAVRHSFAIGFIALLMCGIAPRMLSSFSGGTIVSPRLVSATLWLGNAAVILRVGAPLLAPLLSGTQDAALNSLLLGFSGPCGLALAICLVINLWPTMRSSPQQIA